MEVLWITLTSIMGAGVLGFVTACATGQLVPGTRVEHYQESITRLEDAAQKREEAYQTLKGIVDRQALVAEVTAAVVQATRTVQQREVSP